MRHPIDDWNMFFSAKIRFLTYKLGCVVKMVVNTILPHAESGRNDHRKDAPPFILCKIIGACLVRSVLFLDIGSSEPAKFSWLVLLKP